MIENSHLSSKNPVTVVDDDLLLSEFVVVNPIVVCSITFIIGILINSHSVLAASIPYPEPCITKSLFE